MDLFKFLLGKKAGLAGVPKKKGNLTITEDTGELYVDTDGSTRKQIGYSRDDIDFKLSGYVSAGDITAGENITLDKQGSKVTINANVLNGNTTIAVSETKPKIWGADEWWYEVLRVREVGSSEEVHEVLYTTPYNPAKQNHVIIDSITESIIDGGDGLIIATM